MKLQPTTLPALAVLATLAAPLSAAAQTAPTSPAVEYRVLPGSRFEVRTTSEGIFGFAGDDHLIRAGSFQGRAVYDPDTPSRSRVELAVPVDSLRVLTPVDDGDRRQIRTRMRFEVLNEADHPEIRFRSSSVEGLPGDTLRVTGDLTVAGSTRPVTLKLGTHLSGDTLRVFGGFDARLSDFGIEPPGVAMGTVKVGDRVRFVVDASLARGSSRTPRGSGSPPPPRARSEAPG